MVYDNNFSDGSILETLVPLIFIGVFIFVFGFIILKAVDKANDRQKPIITENSL